MGRKSLIGVTWLVTGISKNRSILSGFLMPLINAEKMSFPVPNPPYHHRDHHLPHPFFKDPKFRTDGSVVLHLAKNRCVRIAYDLFYVRKQSETPRLLAFRSMFSTFPNEVPKPYVVEENCFL